DDLSDDLPDDLSDEALAESEVLTESEEEPDEDDYDGFYDVPSDPSPIDLDGIEARFHADIAYGDKHLNTFDIFIARTKEPAPLVIYIHGGGFTMEDKSDAYEAGGPFVIRSLLENGISFASVNYQLLEQNDKDGVIKPLNDCKRALQFIRSEAEVFNIDKERIVSYGFSAGAGASLWIGFNDDMADPESEDPVLRESTRLKGVAALETQATYDIVRWETEIFKPYDITLKSFVNLGFGSTLYSFYGVSSLDEIYTPAITEYRKKVDMLDLMSADDPEIFVNNGYNDAGKPTNIYALYHHPYHASALMEEAEKKGLQGIFYIPAMNIIDESNEELIQFFLRKLKY
ncbi:MAG TPA: alpha/beta hydrolase, partial [bacterium]|nr:alpha/beta hydrolase [bacterium]